MNGHIIYPNKFSTDITNFQLVAENQMLKKDDLRVFMFLCGRVGSKHCVKLDKKQISRSLNMKKKDVDKALDNLEYNSIITRDYDEHVEDGYRMSYTGN